MDDRPFKKYINQHVRKNICAAGPQVWLDLGLELLEDEAALKAIQNNNKSEGLEVCFSNMVTLWLERKPTASWGSLIKALENINQHTLASDINGLLDKPIASEDAGTTHLQASYKGMSRATHV